MKETGKDYRLELSGKLDIMGQVSNIPNVIRRYDRHIAYGNELANALDRYDDFATLRIAPSDYENRGGEYGIVRGSLHRGGDVILAHQQDSAGRLLRDLRGFGMLADVVWCSANSRCAARCVRCCSSCPRRYSTTGKRSWRCGSGWGRTRCSASVPTFLRTNTRTSSG